MAGFRCDPGRPRLHEAARRLLAPLAAALLAGPAHAVVYEVAVQGVTYNTEVFTGDPCGTGTSGPLACDKQAIEVVWQIDADLAPADGEPAPGYGSYGPAGAPLFLRATSTINGVAFPYLAGPTPVRSQWVEVLDELNSSGVTDGLRLTLSAGEVSAGESSVQSNLLLGQVFAGDGLDQLAGPFAGAPVLGGSSGFVLRGGAGVVIGQYVVTGVAIGAPEPGAAAAGWGAALGLAAAARGRRGRLTER